MKKTALAIALCLLGCETARPQTAAPVSAGQISDSADFTNWPDGCSPKAIGLRVADHFAVSAHWNSGRKSPPAHIIYPEVCTWYGALTFARLSGNHDLENRLIQRFDSLFTVDKEMIPEPENVDTSVFGVVPFQIYLLNKDPRCLKIGRNSADQQWRHPQKDGLTTQTRYWIDDMYMITSLQTQAFRSTGDAKYLDRAALEMSAYLDKLQQPNGLFYHAPDVPFFWGRGNGWVAAGMSELLRELPPDHPQRARIMDGYKKMMAALLKYQDADGMWHQLIDHPEAWPETSCSGMFTFAFITGVKNGWLDEKTYGPAARKGWLGLIKYIDLAGDISNVCEGTNKKNDLQYYLDRKRNTGDLHGEAPILWCASALLR